MTDCAKCGACCEDIYCGISEGKLNTYGHMERYIDPNTDEGWERWKAVGYLDEDRDEWTAIYNNPNERNRVDATFIMDHWHRIEGKENRWTCDMFDSKTRLCTAHDSRPYICSEYPWYGRTPERYDGDATTLPKACSYNADVRTMLPIVSINGS